MGNLVDIFSVGYQRYTAAQFVALCERFSAVVDCRSVPMSRKPGFSRGPLERAMGHYVWKGDCLGGRGARNTVDPAGLDYLLSLSGRVLIFCLEDAPGDCHRHHAIGRGLLGRGVDLKHLYDHDIVLASELERAFATDTDPFGVATPPILKGLVL